MQRIRRRFWIEAGLSASSFVFMTLTIAWHDWIEIAFGVDLDNHNGFFEWLIVAILALVTITLAVLARIDFRRLRSAIA